MHTIPIDPGSPCEGLGLHLELCSKSRNITHQLPLLMPCQQIYISPVPCCCTPPPFPGRHTHTFITPPHPRDHQVTIVHLHPAIITTKKNTTKIIIYTLTPSVSLCLSHEQASTRLSSRWRRTSWLRASVRRQISATPCRRLYLQCWWRLQVRRRPPFAPLWVFSSCSFGYTCHLFSPCIPPRISVC